MNLFEKLYLSYVNDFISVGKFASYYKLTIEQAHLVINEGKCHHEKLVKIDAEVKA